MESDIEAPISNDDKHPANPRGPWEPRFDIVIKDISLRMPARKVVSGVEFEGETLPHRAFAR
jgi:hypothetical protein